MTLSAIITLQDHINEDYPWVKRAVLQVDRTVFLMLLSEMEKHRRYMRPIMELGPDEHSLSFSSANMNEVTIQGNPEILVKP